MVGLPSASRLPPGCKCPSKAALCPLAWLSGCSREGRWEEGKVTGWFSQESPAPSGRTQSPEAPPGAALTGQRGRRRGTGPARREPERATGPLLFGAEKRHQGLCRFASPP